MVEKDNKNTLDIYPTRLSRRVLATLLNVFISFITSVFIFEIIVKPITYLIPSFQNVVLDHNSAENDEIRILYSQEILFYDEDNQYDFESNLETTCDKYLSYLVTGENESYEVFFTYFVNVKKEDDQITRFSKLEQLYKNLEEGYFDYESDLNSLGLYNLTEEKKNLLLPKYTPGDELTKSGEELYEEFETKIFLNLYKEIILDIKENDIYFNFYNTLGLETTERSYNECSKIVIDTEDTVNLVLSLDSLLSFLILNVIISFVIPLVNKKGRNIGEIVLKIERVDIKTLAYIKKSKRIIICFFELLNNLCLLFFVPVITFGLVDIFSLYILVFLSILSILFLMIELVLVSFTKFNQSLKEINTRSIVCDTSLIDEYYRVKGYE